VIVIGSQAIKFHVPEWREPLDTDLVGTYEEAEQYRKTHKPKVCYPIDSGNSIFMRGSDGHITEIEVAWEGSRAEKLVEFVENDHGTVWDSYLGGVLVPSLDVLYMLKMSHRYKKDSPHFKKTLDDILELRKLGAKIRPEHQEFYEQRMKDTYTNVLPKLNQSKEGFFDNDSSIYTLDHDSIHEAIKNLEKPAYEYFKDGAVWCSKDLWDACDESVKLFAAYEEIGVLSIERSIHPFPNVDKRWAFDMAHMKLATSISSGWFREYVWENYYKIQSMYSEEYLYKFYDALNNGRIKKYGE
jgi:hypothetical protein